MIVTKKAIDRRTVLRGIGACLGLPFLDGMVPALSALVKTAANAPARFGVVYVPNGIVMNAWTPKTAGTDYEFSPILKPLEPFRRSVVVISGLDNRASFPKSGEVLGSHSRPAAAYLTGMHAKHSQGTELELGISMDQIVADALGQESQIPSLELSLEGVDTVNGVSTCDTGYNCAYLNISWRNAQTPMPRETNPRLLFDRLFGDAGSTDPAVQARADQTGREHSRLGDSRRTSPPGNAWRAGPGKAERIS